MAELAGVSIGSLYQYFPNKEALISALGEHHANQMAQLAQSHLGGLGDGSIVYVNTFISKNISTVICIIESGMVIANLLRMVLCLT